MADSLLAASRECPVVTLAGARQAGKAIIFSGDRTGLQDAVVFEGDFGDPLLAVVVFALPRLQNPTGKETLKVLPHGQTVMGGAVDTG